MKSSMIYLAIAALVFAMLGTVHAAPSNNPKEIVVVGSKNETMPSASVFKQRSQRPAIGAFQSNTQPVGVYKCALHYGEWVCTGDTEQLAHQACKVGTGSDNGGCNSNPEGTVSCTCGNNQ